MSPYLYELPEWPRLRWIAEKIQEPLARVRYRQGLLVGRVEGLTARLRQEALLVTLTEDVLRTSEIEGEILEAKRIRSSLARRLGIEIGPLEPPDRDVDGVVELLLNATGVFHAPLTAERLFSWHSMLFPIGGRGWQRIQVGRWRDDRYGQMRVISGPIGAERTHFVAPAAEVVEDEMDKFLTWFNEELSLDWVLKAGLAHLWFVTIHPFDDGNGRIARAIADMCLARSEQSPQRYYSMASQILKERPEYYRQLERTQGTSVDVTPWLEWFLGCLDRAIQGSFTVLEGMMSFVHNRAALIDSLSPRQQIVVREMLGDFEGKLTSSRFGQICGCSRETANREIQDLLDKGILIQNPGGGRSTSYRLADLA